MRVLSVQVGLPQALQVADRSVPSGIVKKPVAGTVRVRFLNLEGDQQADLSVHGGLDKAVYLYPSEHYQHWERELGQSLSWGAFGENLTTMGLAETQCVGDELTIGTAVFVITQPRLPCFKLAAKFQRDGLIKQFLDSRRTGFYLRVVREGLLQAGDTILLRSHEAQVSIREIVDLYLTKHPDSLHLERVLAVPALSASWRAHFQALL